MRYRVYFNINHMVVFIPTANINHMVVFIPTANINHMVVYDGYPNFIRIIKVIQLVQPKLS
jgi:hypothetical protein